MAKAKKYLIIAAILVVVWIMTTARQTLSAATLKRISADWGDLVYKYQKAFPNIPAARIFAHIAKESNGDPNAQGDKDANGTPHSFGLMQVQQAALTDFNRAFQKSYTLEQLKQTPWMQIEVGVGFLELKRRTAGNLAQATRDYNDGNPYRDNEMSIAYGATVEAYNRQFEQFLKA